MDNTIIEGFEPILCFARNSTQTPEEVFEMLQERMTTALGISYFHKGISLFNWKPENAATLDEMEVLSDWQHSHLTLTVPDFDRLGEPVDLSIGDILGSPKIWEDQKRELMKQFDDNDDPDFIDPVITFVILSAIETIDEMAKNKKEFSNN